MSGNEKLVMLPSFTQRRGRWGRSAPLSEMFDIDEGGCWRWRGAILSSGYGVMNIGGRMLTAHRVYYTVLVGPIPDDLQIDHLCRVRNCVRPDHLEAVSIRVNQLRGNGFSGVNARKTECVNGHALTGGNVYVRPDGKGRDCMACRRTRHGAA